MHGTVDRAPSAPKLGRGDRHHRCHECGEPIRGIEASGGRHRFVGCGHLADGHFVESPARARSTLLGITVE
jgi:ssDNA-binding Zn-finger/Zn-ribbon topoisomerase 1